MTRQGRTKTVVTSAGTTTLNYDYEDRVTGITYPSTATNSFTYNGLDTRVGKVDSAGTKTYRRDGVGVTDPVLSDASSTYTPGVSMHTGTATTFQHANYLGSNDAQTNSSQTLTATQVADAWGNLRSSTGPFTGPFGFVGAQGYQQDADSGLTLLGERYYDSSTGRFLTRDSAEDGRNWFGYCNNAPTSYADADGRQAVAVLFGAGVIIGGLVATILYNGANRDKHIKLYKQALKRIAALEQALEKAKGPKARAPIEDELDREGRSRRGHAKEMDEGWPGWRNSL